jgi:hypothetical protein
MFWVTHDVRSPVNDLAKKTTLQHISNRERFRRSRPNRLSTICLLDQNFEKSDPGRWFAQGTFNASLGWIQVSRVESSAVGKFLAWRVSLFSKSIGLFADDQYRWYLTLLTPGVTKVF